ncbi:uncharacterized protein LOC124927828 [Impatiens glandulifera]|uniref:uncharacterized protein LOC124927828 n=1 Tax=Impatiens glandulifera TaxID=253017 RepID=UPI001FB198C3|nr:uncharacterized protein LOC124927828 [Impatiens glandulifera]
MVLWEVTLATAYFLGLKRTYKLALKIQRRLVRPKHAKIRNFVQRRTRVIFDVALKVHNNIQERDIEVGRNVGNWILRWLDRIKPSAQIRSHHLTEQSESQSSAMKMKAWSSRRSSSLLLTDKTRFQKFKTGLQESSPFHNRKHHLFARARNMWWSSKPFPTISAGGSNIFQSSIRYMRFLGNNEASRMNLPRWTSSSSSQGVIRNDIMLWMQQRN